RTEPREPRKEQLEELIWLLQAYNRMGGEATERPLRHGAALASSGASAAAASLAAFLAAASRAAAMAASSTSSPAPGLTLSSVKSRRKPRAPGLPFMRPVMWRVMQESLVPRSSSRAA